MPHENQDSFWCEVTCGILAPVWERGPMERAIKDLCQLPDARLFEEVATGIGHVVRVVGRLDAATHNLSEVGNHHAAQILGNLAEEEAAKVLILLDAVRCPRNKQTERSRVLGYFHDHLAKGLYAEVCHWRPIDFAEVTRRHRTRTRSTLPRRPQRCGLDFPQFDHPEPCGRSVRRLCPRRQRGSRAWRALLDVSRQ